MSAAEVLIGSASVGGAAFGGLALVSTMPRSEFWGGVRASGDRNGNRFALTFDDGPSADSTGQILDALGELKCAGDVFRYRGEREEISGPGEADARGGTRGWEPQLLASPAVDVSRAKLLATANWNRRTG